MEKKRIIVIKSSKYQGFFCKEVLLLIKFNLLIIFMQYLNECLGWCLERVRGGEK